MRMQLNDRSPQSANIKIGLLIAALCCVIPILLYTHHLVFQLQKKEQEVATLYAKSLEYIANSTTTGTDYSFIFNEVIHSIDFPVILTDKNNAEIIATRNIDIDSAMSADQRAALYRSLISEMDRSNKPIVIAYQDTIVLNRLHYGESPVVTKLRWLPYIEISIAALFILIGYIGFSYIKRSEQSNIWVGMARETAHQLGTPLSSTMGWIEVLKHHAEKNPSLMETVTEFENDVQRLKKVADRFSKIGSRPDLREEDIAATIGNVIRYFETRLPQMGKKVDIRLEAKEPVAANINRELFEWVIENLIKNALDAMEDGKGTILFILEKSHNNTVVDVTDTGKGIDPAFRNDIFRPGFTTKKRGWGLGLSLAKRIIESYHHGKLLIKESVVGKGTTFRIILR